MTARPSLLVAVAGTTTAVGKTWVTARVLEGLRARGYRVSVRKPVQSYGPEDAGATDAEVLAAASGESPSLVCPRPRWYAVPMAPPIAAAHLGEEPPTLAGLLGELRWRSPGADVGFVETVGGVRSPLADDGDSGDLIRLLGPDAVLLVADADLGVIDATRLAAGALAAPALTVFLNRYSPEDTVHRGSLEWLRERDGFTVETTVEDLLARVVSGVPWR
ncbi:MAG: ATP-dependent dethiobiotin synthetase BioD [bacterium]|nr:ATP-dependent dethiobiotin synthetase BioD [bacterium]